jgi:hypothetical protein
LSQLDPFLDALAELIRKLVRESTELWNEHSPQRYPTASDAGSYVDVACTSVRKLEEVDDALLAWHGKWNPSLPAANKLVRIWEQVKLFRETIAAGIQSWRPSPRLSG